jgi:DNA-binding NtrC family response regulator
LHRIGTIVLHVPPLRQRKGDIPALSTALLLRMQADVGVKELTRAALEHLTHYDWPGNVRELRSVLYRAAVNCDGPEIDLAQVCQALPDPSSARSGGLSAEQVRRLLDHAGGNVAKAARLANVARSTFRSWVARAEAPTGSSARG